MTKKRIGYTALLSDLLERGVVPIEVEAIARGALGSSSQFEQWQAARAVLDALARTGGIRLLDGAVNGNAVRFVDMSRAQIITLAPPPVPVRDYEVHPAPQIPESIQSRERLALVDSILTSIATCQTEAELGGTLEKIASFVRGVVPCTYCAVNPLPSWNGTRAAEGVCPLLRSVVQGSELFAYLEQRVAREGRTLYIPDLAREPVLRPQLVDDTIRSGAVFPLATGGEIFGVLEAWDARHDALSEEDLGLLALLANVAGGVIKNARRLERLIFVDPLTEVHTRGFFDEELRREIERSNRNGESLALLMVDIDHFKNVNDTHGHAAGDKALKAVAALIKSKLRQVDLVTRYGGEEFALLLPGTNEEEARLAAERLRAVVEKSAITVSDSRAVRLTLSVGGALYPDHARNQTELLDRADRVALLRAKRDGRNRVVMWTAALDRGA